MKLTLLALRVAHELLLDVARQVLTAHVAACLFSSRQRLIQRAQVRTSAQQLLNAAMHALMRQRSTHLPRDVLQVMHGTVQPTNTRTEWIMPVINNGLVRIKAERSDSTAIG